MKKIMILFTLSVALLFSNANESSAASSDYKVKKGDSLYRISLAYNTNVANLKAWNNLTSNLIYPNQTLAIQANVKQTKTKSAKKSSTASSVYTVKKGDSLYKISRANNTSVANIKAWNNLKSNMIYPNQKLAIKAKAKQAKTQQVNNKKATTKVANTPSRNSAKKSQKEMMMTATAYTASCNGCSGITKTGINLKKNPNLKVIAVDSKVIPLGTKVHVEGYGYAVAGDIGGAIKGNKIDVFIPTKNQALKWGRKQVKVTILQ